MEHEGLYYGGWPTTPDKATGAVAVKINPGSQDESLVMVPITTNPTDALPFPILSKENEPISPPVQAEPAAEA